MDWNDITLLQYSDLQETYADESMSDKEKLSRSVKIVFDIAIEDLPLFKLNGCIEYISKLTNTPPRRNKPKKHYTLNGHKYKFISPEKGMTAGQFLDFQEFCKEPEKNITKIISCFLIPEDKTTYSKDYDVEEVWDDVWFMGVEDAFGINFTLANLLKKSQKRTLVFLLAQTLMDWQMKWREKKTIIKAMIRAYNALDYLTF